MGIATMSREAYEQSEAAWIDEMFAKGPGDPDVYGYPGQKDEPPVETEPVDPEVVPF